MATLPNDRRELVAFGMLHDELWVAKMSEIGLNSQMTTDFKEATEEAFTAMQAADAARQAAKAATEIFYNKVRDLRSIGSDCVRAIQTYARNGHPDAYGTAQIPGPQPRGQGQPPAQPYDIRAELNSNGSITLTWKCSNPNGVSRVVYQVTRRLAGQTSFTLIDGVGEKRFNDLTLPAGTASASYIITGRAGGLSGPASEQFTVQFGIGGDGQAVLLTSGTADRKAA